MATVRKLKNVLFSRCNFKDFRSMYLPNLIFLRSSSMESFKFSDLQIQNATESQKMEIPDASTLIFGETFSDHMFEVKWNINHGWETPRIIPLHPFQLHPGSKIFHYAQAVFEGMKAFKSSEGSVTLFRPELNIKRLLASAERASLPLFDGDEFLKCLKKLISVDKEWVPCSASSSLYIRPTFIGTQSSLGVHASNAAILYIITCPVGPYFKSDQTKPVSLLADPNYVRAWPGGVGDKKMACNYASSLYVQKSAVKQGLSQVLWLIGDNQKIAEAGAMNVFFFFRKGLNEFELATPALDGTILPGIIRRSLLDLADKYKEFEVSERTITMDEIIAANEKNDLLEMFVCGTASVLCPVDRIRYLQKDIRIPTMMRGKPLYQRLYNELVGIQYGRISSEWSVKVD